MSDAAPVRPDNTELYRAAWRFIHPEDSFSSGRLEKSTIPQQRTGHYVISNLVWIPQPHRFSADAVPINSPQWDDDVLRRGMWYEDPYLDDIEYFALTVLAQLQRHLK